jgi:hypothetical protein
MLILPASPLVLVLGPLTSRTATPHALLPSCSTTRCVEMVPCGTEVDESRRRRSHAARVEDESWCRRSHARSPVKEDESRGSRKNCGGAGLLWHGRRMNRGGGGHSPCSFADGGG